MNWLPIMEYSINHSISPSTIRRKIKNGSINFRLENGKYLIQDEPKSGDATISTDQKTVEDVVSFAEKALREINTVNAQIISEKDKMIAAQEQTIKSLKEEIAELKMLIAVLEKGQH